MINLFYNFCERFIAGIYSIKLESGLYFNLPKIAPIFLFALIFYAIGNTLNIKTLNEVSVFLMVVVFFGFFYYKIFPNRLNK